MMAAALQNRKTIMDEFRYAHKWAWFGQEQWPKTRNKGRYRGRSLAVGGAGVNRRAWVRLMRAAVPPQRKAATTAQHKKDPSRLSMASRRLLRMSPGVWIMGMFPTTRVASGSSERSVCS